jgi:hypothetical protein
MDSSERSELLRDINGDQRNLAELSEAIITAMETVLGFKEKLQSLLSEQEPETAD